ncbi:MULTISPECIES: hypothetical protein [Methylomonas]|uniref:Uncharacterized protein n=1 Tax=Methylomonas koyamae TaxID=702114 RepID=A0A177NW52_9GAMM|nr:MULTISPECIES: hypothetical protein [Methylomonas]ANE55792.1 hypothetical protein AYM39_11770 [Methylomonas sp. DH-1]ATG90650.1 hypothetical protein MKLM6_2429 [Methylomonas koyamae]OAI12239.1 hypothetical protein A1507_01720 [Methylomonas koyamae]OAI22277.1 hypothetical protein A1356_02485 [Methylomonas koyamae]WNB77733.1 hypothetical protein RI210_09160 [Methylomonas koyamae]
MKKLVSIRALTARINRKLAKESKKLLKYQPRLKSDNPLVEYAVVDLKTNAILNFHMAGEIQEFARELGCLSFLEDVSLEADSLAS